jgi:hypothetical protein
VIKTIQWLFTSERREVCLARGRGEFSQKKQEKLKQKKEATTNMAVNTPSSECREFLVGLHARFYEAEFNMAMEMKYI